MNYWTDRCEPPRSRPPGIEWDVFISYRSVDRVWALALRDMLRQLEYSVFMDQFVLVVGQGLPSQLGQNLQKSSSGVLIWSEKASDSRWVESEFNSMISRKNDTADSEFPFYFVVSSLDGKKPPGLEGGQLYLDFSEYPDGPMGADMVRLTHGLQGKPLSEDAVRSIVEFESTIRQEPARLRALAKSHLYDSIVESASSEEPAYTTSATLSAVAVDLLIRGKKYKQAIEAAELARSRFPGSVRLRQLHGLALRRDKRIDEASFELNRLLEEGHRDTETLGILAAVLADKWELLENSGDSSAARDVLELSRNLYEEGFTKVPTDTYNGINAASKSALLGEFEKASAIATKVLELLKHSEKERGGGPSPDYWERVTVPEALLLVGQWQAAVDRYHEARIAHQEELGSIESTAKQVERLLRVLDVPDEFRKLLSAEFKLTV